MIATVADLAYYLEADRIALGRQRVACFSRLWLAAVLFPDRIWEFQVSLRRLEYLHNQKRNVLLSIRKTLVYRRYLSLSRMLGFTIPVNVFGPGLSIAHHGTIVVSSSARIGANCRLHACVNIGTSAGTSGEAPTIGDDVYIGPGAKIFGRIEIADGCAIGANAVVNKSFLKPGSKIVGVPARDVGVVDTGSLLVKATDILKRQRVGGE
jgi:serine O-acetyltransferase